MKKETGAYRLHARPGGLAAVELMHAAFRTQRFAPHRHDNYAVGVIEEGALAFRYRGENLVGAPGHICLVIPDEVHDGHPASDNGWRYRMFYLQADLMRDAAEQVGAGPSGLPYFKAGVIRDDPLAAIIARTHRRLTDRTITRLEAESSLLAMLAPFLLRHARPAPAPRPIGPELRAMARLRDFIESHDSLDLSLRDLARQCGLTPFHLIRSFRRATGLTPHAYVMQVKTRRARALLDRGVPIVDAALQAGFADQSHLNRLFKRTFGYTPGQYRNSIQDADRKSI